MFLKLLGDMYTCGNIDFGFSADIPNIISAVVTIIKIAVPVLLVVFGMLDLGKAVIASKEDEIKKGQQLLIKRVITALIVFFIVQIVQTLVSFVAGKSDENVIPCMNCFLNATEKTDNSSCKPYLGE